MEFDPLSVLPGYAADYELRPTTMKAALAERGWLPNPYASRWSEDRLANALQRLVYDLSWLHVYLHCTDHLSDEELYETLLEAIEYDHIDIYPDDPESAITLHLASSLYCEDPLVYYRYYATERDREFWLQWHPGEALPESEPIPFPRQHWMPQRPD